MASSVSLISATEKKSKYPVISSQSQDYGAVQLKSADSEEPTTADKNTENTS